MTKTARELAAETAREFLQYDPETGVLTWKERDRKNFETEAEWKRWNKRYSWKRAGHFHTKTGYRRVRLEGILHREHRVIWLIQTGEWPVNHIDHINQLRDDNRWDNLREATAAENQQNSKRRSNNTSGYTGVSFDKASGKWRVQIKIEGHSHHLGYYDAIEQAIAAWTAYQAEYGFSVNHGIDINNGESPLCVIDLDHPETTTEDQPDVTA